MYRHIKISIQIHFMSLKKEKVYGSFNYIGSKLKLLDFLKISIEDYVKKDLKDIDGFGDFFSGTGVVGYYFMKNGIKRCISNDIQYYGYVVSSVMTTKDIRIDLVKTLVNELNDLVNKIKLEPTEKDFCHNTYTNCATNVSKRMYLTELNGYKVDKLRQKISEYKVSGKINDKEYLLLLKILLYAVTKVSNITSVYGAYLKSFKKCSLNDIQLDITMIDSLIPANDITGRANDITGRANDINLNLFNIEHITYNENIRNLVKNLTDFPEVVYLDPPYNNRNYSSNYHLLETVALYDYPEVKGITGTRLVDESGSKIYCSKVNTKKEFSYLFDAIKSKYLFMSYNSEGLVSKEDIIKELSKNWKDIKCFEQTYQRFKSNSDGIQVPSVIEYLFASTRKEI